MYLRVTTKSIYISHHLCKYINICIDEEEMKFKANIWKTGNSYVVTIPNDYIKNDMIQKEKRYQFEIEEMEE